MKNNDLDLLKRLVQRGVTLSAWRYSDDRDVSFLPSRVYWPSRDFAAFLRTLDGQIPAKTCKALADKYAAVKGDRSAMSDLVDRCAFSAEAKSAILKEAIRGNEAALVKKLLRQGLTPGKGRTYDVFVKPGENADEIKKVIERCGATVKIRSSTLKETNP